MRHARAETRALARQPARDWSSSEAECRVGAAPFDAAGSIRACALATVRSCRPAERDPLLSSLLESSRFSDPPCRPATP
ncbi:unnamed protein product [Colias eurytheme]|nr:unnamed protein product [Colias eurytheme]